MSHLALRTDATLSSVQKTFAPRRCDGGGWIVRLKESFIAALRPTMLMDAAAVRSGFSQDFFLRIDWREGIVTIRVEPLTIVEHNEGVQRAIIGAAVLVAAAGTQTTIDKYNLVPELRDETDQLLALAHSSGRAEEQSQS